MSELRTLPRDFYLPTAEAVAPALLGHWLVRRTPEGLCAGVIVETEAYLSQDPACHAAVGETARNRTMWGEPGKGYVYLIYGYHCCVNAVCCPAGTAEAVLIRAVEPIQGESLMQRFRPVPKLVSLTNGPAKLCAAMNIDRKLDGADLCDEHSPLFIARNPALELFRHERGPVLTSPRIGISQAADWPLRFFLEGSPFVSRRAAGQSLAKIKLRQARLPDL